MSLGEKKKRSEMLKVASPGSEILGSFHSLSPYNFLFCLFFATSMYRFYIWGRVEIFFLKQLFSSSEMCNSLSVLRTNHGLSRTTGCGQDLPHLRTLHSEQGHGGTLILATDGWSCGGRGGSVRCSPIQRGKRVIGGEEWAGREQMGGWEA